MSGERRGLVVTNGVVQLQQCTLYLSHHTAIVDAHHVCPEAWWRAAGVPDASPLQVLCPDCHSSTHAAIDGLIKSEDISLLPPRCRTLAWRALDLAQQNGLTPALTL